MSRNRLAEETSPYLLQHAGNPAHCRPWGPEALAAAAEEDKPVLLSVGYAACHWCHVMAHESFEDPGIAALMNARYVNVKVDREERPDIDTIYQHALQLLGQQGGWPLTMFLAPDGRPFWGGTYFPPEPRFGRPGFPQVLEAVADHWSGRRGKALEAAAALGDGLRRIWTQEKAGADGVPPLSANDRAAERLAAEFDMTNGGFGRAPKFPNPSIHELLWRTHLRAGDETAGRAVLRSLTAMCQGGIYDHLGGGFARYSTDDAWLVPHFEKMLYDNAQLVDLLTWAWQRTGDPLYAERVAETVAWALREMAAPPGAEGDRAFAASYDADSEGEEGLFYTWTWDELGAVLGDGPDADLFRGVYGATARGNWEGRNILNRIGHPEPLDAGKEAALAAARRKLLAARGGRAWPGWDDKILADWNGLMIAALAQAARVFGRPGWLAAAESAFRFVRGRMTGDGRLLHSWRGGRARHAATLDDYANMARAALVLHEATGGDGYLAAAKDWAAVADARYRDDAEGGYFLTADDAEALIVRTKTAADNATPAGNATMAGVLARLFYLTGDDAYRLGSEAVLSAFSGEIAKNPFACPAMLCANEFLQRCTQIVVAGDPDAPDARALADAAWRAPCMNRLIVPAGAAAALPPGHPAGGKGPVGGKAAAYVCVGQACSLPLTDPEALRAAL